MLEFSMQKFKTNLNPCEVFSTWKNEKNVILLDSSKLDSKYSKFSFIGVNPRDVFSSKFNKITFNKRNFEGDAFKFLKQLFQNQWSVDIPSEYNRIPFLSGAIGYISYDMGRTLEDFKYNSINDFEINDSQFIFFENIIIFDLENNIQYVSSINGDSSINAILEKINNIEYEREENFTYNEDFSKFKSNFGKEQYKTAVTEIKNYIKDGHTYIANMTQRFMCDNTEDGYHIYKKLRNINPAPFSAYLNLDDMQIISSSPERFLNIVNNKVETRPIKGTMPRGTNKIEDLKNRDILMNSEKDKSELLMVVDLERNDLSKVCEAGSIKVTELFKIEEYATVFHLVSTIEGQLKDNNTAIDCIKACFPGGSITGTPKYRTMEIIDEIEKLSRGLYTGCIGYFDTRGNCDFNIVIRTIVKKENNAYFGVGGGITIESDEESEYLETLDKAKALMRVL